MSKKSIGGQKDLDDKNAVRDAHGSPQASTVINVQSAADAKAMVKFVNTPNMIQCTGLKDSDGKEIVLTKIPLKPFCGDRFVTVAVGRNRNDIPSEVMVIDRETGSSLPFVQVCLQDTPGTLNYGSASPERMIRRLCGGAFFQKHVFHSAHSLALETVGKKILARNPDTKPENQLGNVYEFWDTLITGTDKDAVEELRKGNPQCPTATEVSALYNFHLGQEIVAVHHAKANLLELVMRCYRHLYEINSNQMEAMGTARKIPHKNIFDGEIPRLKFETNVENPPIVAAQVLAQAIAMKSGLKVNLHPYILLPELAQMSQVGPIAFMLDFQLNLIKRRNPGITVEPLYELRGKLYRFVITEITNQEGENTIVICLELYCIKDFHDDALDRLSRVTYVAVMNQLHQEISLNLFTFLSCSGNLNFAPIIFKSNNPLALLSSITQNCRYAIENPTETQRKEQLTFYEKMRAKHEDRFALFREIEMKAIPVGLIHSKKESFESLATAAIEEAVQQLFDNEKGEKAELKPIDFDALRQPFLSAREKLALAKPHINELGDEVPKDENAKDLGVWMGDESEYCLEKEPTFSNRTPTLTSLANKEQMQLDPKELLSLD